jgi:SAM-dependent methyltransferase
MANDQRGEIYHDLHQGQLTQQELSNRHSARTILSMIREYFDPRSIIDVGCGLGTWLKVAQEMGIADVRGVEGPWLKREDIVVASDLIVQVDLEKPFSLNRRFDMAVCLEVGEHLASTAAENLVDSLTAHADCVLYSAAIPFQGGHHHVNEQFLSYWVDLFAKRNYVVIDLIRGRIWEDKSILWWLRQNIVLFVHRDYLKTNEKLATEQKVNRPVSVVHPDIYISRLQDAVRQLQEHRQLIGLLSQGGTFRVTATPDGRLNITRT